MGYAFRSAVHLFLLRGNEVLLQRRYNTGYMDGHYSVIAGHLEGDESTTDAMIREAREEAGICLSPDQLEMVGVMHRKSGEERIDFFFAATDWEGEPAIMETDKSDDLSWFATDELPLNTVPYVRKALANYYQQQWFDTFGFPQH